MAVRRPVRALVPALGLALALLAGCAHPRTETAPLFPEDCGPLPYAAAWSEPGLYAAVVARGGQVTPPSPEGSRVSVPALAGLETTFEGVGFQGGNGSAALGVRSGIFSVSGSGADAATLDVLLRDFLHSVTGASDADIDAWVDAAQASTGEIYAPVPESVPLRVEELFGSATLRDDAPQDLGRRSLEFGPWTLALRLPTAYLEVGSAVVFVDQGDAAQVNHGSAATRSEAMDSARTAMEGAGLPTAHLAEAEPLLMACL